MSFNKSSPHGMDLLGVSQQFSYSWPGPGNTITNQNYGNVHWTDTFFGSPNPSWKAQVRNHVNAATNASGKLYKVDSFPVVYARLGAQFGDDVTHNSQIRHVTYSGNPVNLIPGAFDEFNVDTSTLNQVTARVVSDFLNKAKSAISSFQSGQDIVEIHQTIESIIHPLASLRSHVSTYFRDLKKIKGRLSKIRNPTNRSASFKKALADTYLEWTFGWNPLAADIAAGIVDLSSQRNRFESTPIKSKAKARYQFTLTDNVRGYVEAFLLSHRLVTGEYSIRLIGSVNAYYNGSAPSLAQNLQLLPEDFIPTAWNVLPYSFVIDYFLNVGDVIDAFSFPSAAIRWAVQTSRDTTRTLESFSQYLPAALAQFPPPSWSITDIGCDASNLDVSVIKFTRTSVNPIALIPPLVFDIPPLSSKPWRNIVALVSGSKRLVTPFA
jgi:hypothetical protein